MPWDYTACSIELWLSHFVSYVFIKVNYILATVNDENLAALKLWILPELQVAMYRTFAIDE